MTQLTNNWVLWFHDPSDNKWDINSYSKLITITNINEFWLAYKFIDSKILIEGMFFLMKENIEPLWENKDNIDGGCWSYKINKYDVYNSWIELSIALVNNSLTKDEENNNIINGISISPKKTFSIIKIWNNNSEFNNSSLLSKKIPGLYVNNCIFKSHKSRN